MRRLRAHIAQPVLGYGITADPSMKRRVFDDPKSSFLQLRAHAKTIASFSLRGAMV
jgi:hypothetical protein